MYKLGQFGKLYANSKTDIEKYILRKIIYYEILLKILELIGFNFIMIKIWG